MLMIERIVICSPSFRECKTFRLSIEVRVPDKKLDALADMRYRFKSDFIKEVADSEYAPGVFNVTLKEDVYADEGLYNRLAQELLVRLLKVVGQPWLILPAVTTHI
jgi:hypothetical protein